MIPVTEVWFFLTYLFFLVRGIVRLTSNRLGSYSNFRNCFQLTFLVVFSPNLDLKNIYYFKHNFFNVAWMTCSILNWQRRRWIYVVSKVRLTKSLSKMVPQTDFWKARKTQTDYTSPRLYLPLLGAYTEGRDKGIWLKFSCPWNKSFKFITG